MNSKEYVEWQYANGKNLAIRKNLYQKHGVNKQDFTDWLFTYYQFPEECRILELGCGNGDQWQGRLHGIPKGCRFLFSDFSEGMVETVRRKFSGHGDVSFMQIDIQSIPLEDEMFDAVIANHMLYHVPDLRKALSEVKRVLKKNGRFYAATNGNGGMRPFLQDSLKRFSPETQAFSQTYDFHLQNGKKLLSEYFSEVKRMDYDNALSITETKDLMDWITSSVSAADFPESEYENLFYYLEGIRKKEGAIKIPLEVGLFIAEK